MFHWFGIAIADIHYLYKVSKELRSKKEISGGDLARTIRVSLEKRDVAIRVHVESADENTDRPFSRAIEEEDIPDYTILLNPSKELRTKNATEMFDPQGQYGHMNNGKSFVTSELVVVPGTSFSVDYRSMFVLGRLRNPSPAGKFLEFRDIPLSDLLITQCFLVENKKGLTKCYEVSPHRAGKNLLFLTQSINAGNSMHVGMRQDANDRFGEESRIFSELKR
jgi:hypothetical protein